MKTIVYSSIFSILICLSASVYSQNLKEGIDTLSTISSFEAIGEFYKMDYSGDYNNLLDMLDDQMTGNDKLDFDSFNCSLFSANGDLDNQLFGRNFDNNNNDVLFTRFQPPDGYSSMAFTRMTDMGFPVGTNYSNLTFNQKLPLLHSAYFVPDGINEHGLAAGLASVPAVQFILDPAKDTIFITRLIREILDHAQSVDEALEIANSFNVFDSGIGILSHHILVGSPNGESLVLEYADGEFKAVETTTDWQVLTNIFVYNIPHEQLMNSCWRYNALYSILEENNGIMSWEAGMSALEEVHMNCPWSALYDMTNRAIYIAINNNYENITFTNLENFEFVVYVDINTPKVTSSSKILTAVYPNPLKSFTNIEFELTEKANVEVNIHDQAGRKIKCLQNSVLNPGKHSICWDTRDENSNNVNPGIYVCSMNTNGKSESKRMVLLK